METVAYTLVKVEKQALVKKLFARLSQLEFYTCNHRVVYVTAVNTVADMSAV